VESIDGVAHSEAQQAAGIGSVSTDEHRLYSEEETVSGTGTVSDTDLLGIHEAQKATGTGTPTNASGLHHTESQKVTGVGSVSETDTLTRVFLNDTFNSDAAGSLANHSPEVGGAWSKVGTGNNFGNNTSTGHCEIDQSGDTFYKNAAVPSSADYYVEAAIGGTGGWARLYARYVDGTNCYSLVVNYNAGVSLYRGTTLLGTLSDASTAGIYRLEVKGTAIKVYKNGSLIISATDGVVAAAGSVVVGGARDPSYSSLFTWLNYVTAATTS
jgi:hypothetical protein